MSDNFSSGYADFLLYGISFVSVILGIYIIISKNPVISILFLIALFCSISAYLLLIGLHFLALSYLLVYVGAISILFLFILMLINIRVSELLTNNTNSISLAILVLLCLSYIVNDIPFHNLSTNLLYNEYDFYSNNNVNTYNYESILMLKNSNTRAGIVSSINWDNIIISNSHIVSIGNILYTNLFIPFIILSLILLLAMVGAIIITVNVY